MHTAKICTNGLILFSLMRVKSGAAPEKSVGLHQHTGWCGRRMEVQSCVYRLYTLMYNKITYTYKGVRCCCWSKFPLQSREEGLSPCVFSILHEFLVQLWSSPLPSVDLWQTEGRCVHFRQGVAASRSGTFSLGDTNESSPAHVVINLISTED